MQTHGAGWQEAASLAWNLTPSCAESKGSPFGEQGRWDPHKNKREATLVLWTLGLQGAVSSSSLPSRSQAPAPSPRWAQQLGPVRPSLGTKPRALGLSQARSAVVPWGLCFFSATAPPTPPVPRI